MIAKWRDETFESFERKRAALRFTSGHGFHAEPLFISAFATLSPFRLSKKAFTCQSECRGNWVWNAGDWASTSIGYFGARLKIKPKQSSGKSWQIWNTFNLWPQQIIITSNPTSEIKNITGHLVLSCDCFLVLAFFRLNSSSFFKEKHFHSLWTDTPAWYWRLSVNYQFQFSRRQKMATIFHKGENITIWV